LSSAADTAYVPTTKRKALRQRRDLDLLLGDWGVHHLHLGLKHEPNGRT